MFFYLHGLETAQDAYQRLINQAVTSQPPCRAKVHLAKSDESNYVVALIYPAEFDDEMSMWLEQGSYYTQGQVLGGVGAVESYYEQAPEILKRHQLFGTGSFESRSGDELLVSLKRLVQR
jgi:hypothetical protein